MKINLTKVKQFAARLRLESRYGVYESRPHYEDCAYILMGRKPKRGRYRGSMAVCPLWIRSERLMIEGSKPPGDMMYALALTMPVPDAGTLDEFVRRYPDHADALTEFAVELALDPDRAEDDDVIVENLHNQ